MIPWPQNMSGLKWFHLGVLLITLSVTHCNGDVGYFWHVTDFHYDWTYDDQQLSCQKNVTEAGTFGDYWCDSPWSLVNNSIHAMANIRPDADFIVWTGDNVAHIANDKMDLSDAIDVNWNITDLFKDTFPITPVYATFGNHDFYPHNQVPVANFSDKLFAKMAEKWDNWIVDPAQIDNFKKGGYYSVKTRHGLRILSLNTNLYYTSNQATTDMDDPLEQFSWTGQVLAAARTANEKVIVIAHISPGVSPPTPYVQWMSDKNNQRLLDMFKEYSDVIIAMHFGHDHADMFRLLIGPNGNDVPMFLAPSVTPWRYIIPIRTGPAHNPGIRLVKYDRATSEHLDYTQYYINMPDVTTNPQWKPEYTFTTAYSVQNLNGRSVKTAVENLKKESHESTLRDYVLRKDVTPDPQYRTLCDKDCLTSYLCGFTNFDSTSFDACVSEHTSGAQPRMAVVSSMVISIMICVSVTHGL